MNIVIVSIHVTAAVILVLTVLLQAGKGAGMGAAFGGSSGSVFGARGPATLISKITCAAAVVFMCTSLNMAISQGGLSRGSVMDEWSSETGATPAPVAAPVSSSSESAVPAEFVATPAPAATAEPAAAPENAMPAAPADEASAPDGVAVAGEEPAAADSQALTEPADEAGFTDAPQEDPALAVAPDQEPAE